MKENKDWNKEYRRQLNKDVLLELLIHFLKLSRVIVIIAILCIIIKPSFAQVPYTKTRGNCTHYYSGEFPGGREELITIICRNDNV